MKRNIHVVIDGQAGSCGKAKVISQKALDNKAELAISNNMPNAGHTTIIENKKRIFRQLPVSSVSPNTILFLGAGTAIDMDVLEQEYFANKDILEGRKIFAHPNIALIEKRHKDYEKEVLKSGSTFKGCGAAYAEKAMRNPELKFFKGYKNITVLSNSEYHELLHQYLDKVKYAILEGSQGCDLDINHSGHYPYVTCRPINVAQMFSDAGISNDRKVETTMVIRPFPIRISNKNETGVEIFSGYYGTSPELTWEQINVGALLGQYPTVIDASDIEEYLDLAPDYTEYTTVTEQKRRIFDLDINQLRRNVEINTPTNVYLNFFQYLDYDYEGLSGLYEDTYINKYHRNHLEWLESELGVPITMLGTGAELSEYIDRSKYQKTLRLRYKEGA